MEVKAKICEDILKYIVLNGNASFLTNCGIVVWLHETRVLDIQLSTVHGLMHIKQEVFEIKMFEKHFLRWHWDKHGCSGDWSWGSSISKLYSANLIYKLSSDSDVVFLLQYLATGCLAVEVQRKPNKLKVSMLRVPVPICTCGLHHWFSKWGLGTLLVCKPETNEEYKCVCVFTLSELKTLILYKLVFQRYKSH